MSRDLLSPYVFLFISEVFSLLILQTCEQYALFGVQLNLYGSTISHIFFVDDTLMFLKADKENCHNLVKLIEIYFEASGQQVNLQKSSVFFGLNVPAGLSEEFGAIL